MGRPTSSQRGGLADSLAPTTTIALDGCRDLTSNPDVMIRFDGRNLDPASAEQHRADYPLAEFSKDGQAVPILRIIEWSTDPGCAIHLCDLSGSVLETISPEIHTPGFNYTSYVLWEEFGQRPDELPLAELQAGEFADVMAAVREQIKTHFRDRELQRRAEQVQKWKLQGDYPYEGEPKSEVERAERETFDCVATSVARKIPRSHIGRRTTLGLLKVAVANEPRSVPQILDQLMPLPKREQDALARLLVRTSMSKLIERQTRSLRTILISWLRCERWSSIRKRRSSSGSGKSYTRFSRRNCGSLARSMRCLLATEDWTKSLSATSTLFVPSRVAPKGARHPYVARTEDAGSST